ncbi:MAG: cupin domain-containing protein [Pseudomonadota bacterium]
MSIRQLAAESLSGISGLMRRVGFAKGEMAKQPLFDMFKIINVVCVGGIHMFQNTDWEMHPDGDEALTLLTGEIDVVLSQSGTEDVIRLRAGQSCVVPKGVWHRQIVQLPGMLLFHTYGDTTQHRTFEEGKGTS